MYGSEEEEETHTHRTRQSKRKRKERVIFDPDDDGSGLDPKPPALNGNEMDECLAILDQLMAHTAAPAFNQPVDWKGLGINDYPTIIKTPMDLGTIRELLLDNALQSPEHFADHVRLVFKNACSYNQPGSSISLAAQNLLNSFERQYERLVDKLLGKEAAEEPPQPRQKKRRVTQQKDQDDPEIAELQSTINQLRNSIKQIQKTIDALKKEQKKPPKRTKQQPVAPPIATIKRIKVTRPRKPLTYEEKAELCIKITNLSSSYLPGLLDVINKFATSNSQEGDEVEIDIEKLDDNTLLEVSKYVTKCERRNARRENRNHVDLDPNEKAAPKAIPPPQAKLLEQSELETQQRIADVQKQLESIKPDVL